MNDAGGFVPQLKDGEGFGREKARVCGIVAGARAAAALAGKWRPSARLSARDLATAVIGGLAMGYGARLAYGCNIGAYLGGLVSGSLHGIWWLVWGFAGSALGVYARGLLAMDPPLAPRPAV